MIDHFGAELSSIKNNAGTEFLWQSDPQVWPRRAPVLFPIVGKLKDNSFKFREQVYHLSQHGFARDMEFELISGDTDFCVFELRSNEKTKSAFPFDFIFRITYRLQEATLTTTYEVVNSSTLPLYFSVGAHPGFRCPLSPGEKFEDYYLEFDQDNFQLTELSEGLRTSGRRPLNLQKRQLFLTTELFDKDALVFENSQISRVSLRSSVSESNITLSCSGWPYFGIWSKKNSREFICLEPWYGIADPLSNTKSLETKDGIICLEKGNNFNCAFSLAFE